MTTDTIHPGDRVVIDRGPGSNATGNTATVLYWHDELSGWIVRPDNNPSITPVYYPGELRKATP